MSVVRLTKEFSFEMAHSLEGYDGACSEIHGHSYRLFVTVRGRASATEGDPKLGMVIDFGVLKAIVNRTVVDRYDHAMLIRATTENAGIREVLKTHYHKIEVVDFQPTCENLISRIASSITTELPDNVELYSLKLHETATSYAEWYKDDNLSE